MAYRKKRRLYALKIREMADRMNFINIRMFVMALATILTMAALSSCADDLAGIQGGIGEEASEMLSIGFRVAAPQTASTRTDFSVEDGIPLESTIDFKGGSYRVFFFDKDNRFITAWSQIGGMHVEKGPGFWDYVFSGQVPDELKPHSDFKVMVLANWPSYPEYKGIDLTGKTISDVVTAEWSCFDALNNFNLSVEDARLIPFYGLKEYSGVVFEDYKTCVLADINLVRAMAKVEVVVNGLPAMTALDGNPMIIGRNPKGLCAMASDVPTDSQPTDVHLIGGRNYEDALTKGVMMLPQHNEDVNSLRWIAYLPEFRNKNEDKGKYSKIGIFLKKTLSDGTVAPSTFYLYFSRYDKFGEPMNDNMEDRFDICRNHWYRFIVNNDEVGLSVSAEVIPYTVKDIEVDFTTPNKSNAER